MSAAGISKPKEQKNFLWHRDTADARTIHILVTWKRQSIAIDDYDYGCYKCSSVHWMHVVNFNFFGEFSGVRVLWMFLMLLLSCIPHAPSTNQLMPNMSANKHEIWQKLRANSVKEKYTRRSMHQMFKCVQYETFSVYWKVCSRNRIALAICVQYSVFTLPHALVP